MKLKTIFIQLFFLFVNSQKCFINNDVINSNNLFTYNGNVYDITNYNHPGGQRTLQRTVGTQLETFLNMPEYSFHLSKNKFTRDLNNLLVGVLKDTCITIPTTTLAPPPTIPTTTLAPPTILSTTLAPPTTIQPTTLAPQTTIPSTTIPSTIPNTTLEPVTTTIPQIISTIQPTILPNCTNKILNLNITYEQQNLIGDYNINNIFQDPNFIKLSLLQNVGGTRISTINFLRYGQFDITMKTPKGLNVITSFYIQTINGYIINFNIINKDNNTLSIIDTNIYNSKLNDVDINSIEYNQPVIVTETFNKYTIIWTPDYYEWRINDIMIRRFNKNEVNIFPDFESKILISLWEAPPSIWGGPGIEWQNAPFDLFISNFDILCYISNSITNNTNNITNANASQSQDNPIINNSYKISYNYNLIINVIFSLIILNKT